MGNHGANRLGANSLLSACVDGWFTLPAAVASHLAPRLGEPLLPHDSPTVQEALARTRARVDALLAIRGSHGPAHFHRRLGAILYEGCGVIRTRETLRTAMEDIRKLRDEFWRDLRVVGTGERLNQDGSKLAHLSLLPTGAQERGRRARSMLAEMELDFGPCSLYGECAKVCPAGIPLTAIAAVDKEGLRSFFRRKAD